MQIHAISYCDVKNSSNTKTSFKSLIKDSSALPIIEKMSKADIFELKQIEKRLSRSKFWDLKIFGAGSKYEEFKFKFISKINRKNTITDGIFPYQRKGNTIKFYSIVYGPENTALSSVDTLKFKTKKRAKELYNIYHKNIEYLMTNNYNLPPIENLKIKETEYKMLEESSKTSVNIFDAKNLKSESLMKNTIGNDLHS